MKIRKTSSKQRSNYFYTFTKASGKEEKITLRPGEDGVTEADIKLLHALDDSEVYHNLKNIRLERTAEEKQTIKKWMEEYVKKETADRGFAPSDDEIKVAVNKIFPRNYNLSLDYAFGDDEETNDDKSRILSQLVAIDVYEESEETLKVRELICQMTEKQKTVLKMVWFDGMTFTDVAKVLGTSIPNVKKHNDKAIDYIRKNYKK